MKEWQADLREILDAKRNNDFIKVGTSELTRGEAERICEYGYFLVNFRGVWQIDYSRAQDCFISRLIIHCNGMVARGRFHVMEAEDINRLFKREMVVCPVE